jgi:hypothetical protein
MPSNSDGGVLSSWHVLYENFSTSTQDFYRAVEEAVNRRNLPDVQISRVLASEGGVGSAKREYLRIQRKRIAFDICSAPYGNGHFFSWWLAKIPAKYGLLLVAGLALVGLPFWMIFETILLKPFQGSFLGMFLFALTLVLGIPVILLGLGFAVEQGIIGNEEWVLSVPWIGYLYMVFFNPTTYYRFDTAMMFRDSVRAAVNEVLNGLREEKGLRMLGSGELLPDQPERTEE